MGDILKALGDNGDEGNTIVVYTADHGLALGQHGLMGKQETSRQPPYPADHRGRLPHGQRLHRISSGMPTPARRCSNWPAARRIRWQGLAGLLPIMNDAEAGWRDSFAAAYRFSQRMIRDSRYKLVRYIDQDALGRGPYRADNTPSRGSHTEQLFDLAADPGETINLAALPAYAAHRDRLSQALDAWQRSVGDPLLAAEEQAAR